MKSFTLFSFGSLVEHQLRRALRCLHLGNVEAEDVRRPFRLLYGVRQKQICLTAANAAVAAHNALVDKLASERGTMTASSILRSADIARSNSRVATKSWYAVGSVSKEQNSR